MLIDLYLQGRLPLDAFVTETIGIGDIDAAFAKMHRGDVLRSVVKSRDDARIDHTVTSGTFSLDGQTFDVDNNVWVVGDDERVRGHRRPARRGGDPRAGRRAPGASRCSAPTPTTTTYGSRPSWAGPSRRRCCCTRPTCRCGS